MGRKRVDVKYNGIPLHANVAGREIRVTQDVKKKQNTVNFRLIDSTKPRYVFQDGASALSCVLGRQCLDRRIESIERLASECEVWNVGRNELQKGVDWQFTTTDARIKLKRLYPHVQT